MEEFEGLEGCRVSHEALRLDRGDPDDVETILWLCLVGLDEFEGRIEGRGRLERDRCMFG